MKIFAKRKKKVLASAAEPGSKERTSFASDPVVEELLKKDPSEWNSKQRRMIKRYQERKEEVYESQHSPVVEDSGSDESEEREEGKAGKEVVSQLNNGSDSECGSGSDSRSSSAIMDQDFGLLKQELDGNDREETSGPHDKDRTGDSQDGKVPPSHEIFKLLEKLNSKMKRTLSRKLDREGSSSLGAVETEAKRALGLLETESKKRIAVDSIKDAAADLENGGSKKNKRKKEVDWSTLPAKERLRREDQRRKQQEAAERRARGENTTAGYKHPLNSERRRANRRKPKWKTSVPPKKEVKNEHNASGYLFRKQVANA